MSRISPWPLQTLQILEVSDPSSYSPSNNGILLISIFNFGDADKQSDEFYYPLGGDS